MDGNKNTPRNFRNVNNHKNYYPPIPVEYSSALFTQGIGRFSDLEIKRMTTLPGINQWYVEMLLITAAGLFGILTQFPMIVKKLHTNTEDV